MKKGNKKIRQNDIRARHNMRQKKRKRLTLFGRVFMFLLFISVCAVIIMFFTPTFNITSIEVEGNKKIDSQEIIAQTGVTIGQNLFKINISQVEKSLDSIAYINSVETERVLFPPALKLIVTECKPRAFITVGEKYLLIDGNCKILEETVEKPNTIPEIVGINLQKYSVGSKIDIDESEKFDIIILCIDKIDELGLISDVNSISVEDISKISFKYQNRLTVICGSELDLDDKLIFFDNIMKSNRLEDNSRGTIDLSTKGKTIYTP